MTDKETEIGKWLENRLSKLDLFSLLKRSLKEDMCCDGIFYNTCGEENLEAEIMIEINKDNYDTEVSTGTILLDFSAPWCGPCRMVAKTLIDVSAERPELRIGTIDVDDNTELAEKFSISGIPLLVLMKDGKEISRNVGATTKAKILEMIDSK